MTSNDLEMSWVPFNEYESLQMEEVSVFQRWLTLNLRPPKVIVFWFEHFYRLFTTVYLLQTSTSTFILVICWNRKIQYHSWIIIDSSIFGHTKRTKMVDPYTYLHKVTSRFTTAMTLIPPIHSHSHDQLDPTTLTNYFNRTK